MQKDVAILLRIGGATGRNILAGILERIKDRDNCTIPLARDVVGHPMPPHLRLGGGRRIKEIFRHTGKSITWRRQYRHKNQC